MIQKSLKASLPWLLFFAGLSLVFLGVFFGENYSYGTESKWAEFCKLIGGAIVSGGIFTFLVRYTQFMGVIKTELSDIIYNADHLKNRSDLHDIWINVSEVVLKNKFSRISKALLKDIKEVYLPTNQEVYYENYHQWIDIKAGENNTIMVRHKTRFTLHVSNKEKSEFKFINEFAHRNNPDGISFESKYVKVNDAIIEPRIEVTNIDDFTVEHAIIFDLEGKEKYNIEKVEEKRYSLDTDNIIGFRTKKLTKNFYSTIRYPQGFFVKFIPCGTINDFDIQNQSEDTLEIAYNSIMYPNQGYYGIIYKN